MDEYVRTLGTIRRAPNRIQSAQERDLIAGFHAALSRALWER
jgi:hypothetical protein